MEQRMYAKFSSEEMEALLTIARIERRHPREQLRLIVCDAARARGLLPEPTSTTAPVETKHSA